MEYMKRSARRRRVAFYERSMFFWPAGLLIIAFGVVARLWNIADHPGWEWDEGVYVYIARNLAQNGLLEFKTDYLAQPEIYAYHPPFHFLLLAQWFKVFGAGHTQARVFAVLGATITMTLLLILLRKVIGNVWALVGVAIIATDTWLNFSQRVAWIENSLIPIGVLGILLYTLAVKKDKTWLYALAGLVAGFAAIYKHIGVIFLGVIIVHALLVRKNWRKDLVAILLGFGVIGAYVLAAVQMFGGVFVHASMIQFFRSTGTESSNGALTSIGTVLGPLLAQYKIYASTVLLAGAAVILVLYRLVQIVVRRGRIDAIKNISVLYAWALAATVFFVGLQLRFPHYSMLAFIPLFCYLVAELSQHVNWKRGAVRWSLIVLAIGILASNVFAFQARYINAGSDSALRDVQQFATTSMPLDAKVIADEATSAVIPQQFCALWQGKDCIGATYIIKYTSSTQQFENNNGQQALVDSGTLVYETHGFKETIQIYKLPKPVTKP